MLALEVALRRYGIERREAGGADLLIPAVEQTDAE